MPQLPDPGGEALPSLQPATGVAQLQPGSPYIAGRAGEFYQQAGAELGQASEIIRQTNAKYDALFAEDALNQLKARGSVLEYGDPQNGVPGFRNQTGSNAMGQKFSDDYQQRLKDVTSDIAGGLQNDQQRQLFQRRADVYGLNFQAALSGHQAQEAQKFANATDDGAVKSELATIATDPYNDIGMHGSLARINGVYDARQDRTGEPQDAARQQSISTAWAVRVHALMNTNPIWAQRVLEDHMSDLGVLGVALQRDVQKEVQQVRARDMAHNLVFGDDSPFAGQDGAQGAPTAKELKTKLPQLMDQARQQAEKLYPNDPIFADAVVARVKNYSDTVVSGFTAQQDAARDQLVRGLVGTQPDGSDKPISIDALLANPQMKEAWRNATPEVQMALQDRFAKGDKALDAQSASLYYSRLGEATGSPEQFVKRDLMKDFGSLPQAQWMQLTGLQKSIGTKDYQDQLKNSSVLDAMSIAEKQVLPFTDIKKPKEGTPEDAASMQAWNGYMGRLTDDVQSFVSQNGRKPSRDETLKMARDLTTQVQVPGAWFGTNAKHAFALTPQQEATATVALTPDVRKSLSDGFQARYGRSPSEVDLQQLAMARLLHANDPAYLNQLDQTLRAGGHSASGRITARAAFPQNAVTGQITGPQVP